MTPPGRLLQPPPGLLVFGLDPLGMRREWTEMQPHVYLLCYIERGTARMVTKDLDVPLAPGDVVLTGPREFRLLDVRGLVGWHLLFSPAEGFHAVRWHAMLKEACDAGPVFSVPPRRRERWSMWLRDVADELRDRRPGHEPAANAQLALVVIETWRLASLGADEEDPIVARMQAVIDRRYAEKLSLADVAAELGLSSAHLSRVIKAATDKTVMQWIEERRMREARRLLGGTDLPVETIAATVGFDDRSYFTRRFSRVHQVAPRHWRDAGRANG